MLATMSILGLYNFDHSIFEGMQLPEGVSFETVRDTILFTCAEHEILYSDPNYMRKAISLWSAHRIPQWEKLYKTTILEYDPIENYNRHETFTDNEETEESGEDVTTRNESTMAENSATSKTTGNSNATENTDVVGFNGAAGGGSGYSPKERTTNTASATNSGNSRSEIVTDVSGRNATDSKKTGKRKNNRMSHIHGNIGVTTSQQMIQSERELQKFDIVDFIVEDFRQRFCILVY